MFMFFLVVDIWNLSAKALTSNNTQPQPRHDVIARKMTSGNVDAANLGKRDSMTTEVRKKKYTANMMESYDSWDVFEQMEK